ncbi:MAG: ribosomal protein L7/L12 [Cyanobacteriota bacterium]
MTYRVVLLKCGPNIVQVIYVIRQATNMSLYEAKMLIDNTPQVIKGQLPYDVAVNIKKEIEGNKGEAIIEEDSLLEAYNIPSTNDSDEPAEYSVILVNAGKKVLEVKQFIRRLMYIADDRLEIIVNKPNQRVISYIKYYEAHCIVSDLKDLGATAIIEKSEPRNYMVIIDKPNYSRLPEIIYIVDGKVNPDGLEIRDFVECIPYTVRYNLTLSDAEEFARKLKALGCKVRVIQEH